VALSDANMQHCGQPVKVDSDIGDHRPMMLPRPQHCLATDRAERREIPCAASRANIANSKFFKLKPAVNGDILTTSISTRAGPGQRC
jgi:hypothetical protein